MSFAFFISVLGLIAIIIPYYISLEHSKLDKKYGREQGTKIGNILGIISGWGLFIFWFGIWISPQPRFIIPFLNELSIKIISINLKINLINLVISVPLIIAGIWFGIKGVTQTTIKVAETHRAKKIIKNGVYSIVRHPQYFGGMLAHLGFSVLLSSIYSLIITPIVFLLIYLISWKEEKELEKEFSQDYKNYKKKVPMLIPKCG